MFFLFVVDLFSYFFGLDLQFYQVGSKLVWGGSALHFLDQQWEAETGALSWWPKKWATGTFQCRFFFEARFSRTSLLCDPVIAVDLQVWQKPSGFPWSQAQRRASLVLQGVCRMWKVQVSYTLFDQPGKQKEKENQPFQRIAFTGSLTSSLIRLTQYKPY